ncbi:hypothetical protein A1O3_07258 [Capronia epimyces CBS 606.96]|uniref:RanBD1 domain-containing protein n=1 Tax=Capronia epimyces CBS 606.96 TaxID=1182542 RepID=W9XUF6_9EURO|nr:uncharacterized protein A1O3_07258 [Capronia epimyces CBS 606.96]EXJ80970.1 hypothetical protein A1O3_07258 [Capronia epimyces CBS 606.96]
MASSNGAERTAQTLEHAEDIHDQTPQDGSSDGEGGERTAREKLKKTSIAGLSQSFRGKAGESGPAGDHPLRESVNAESVPEPHVEDGSRGRPSKKRSFEDLQTEDSGAGVENGGPPLPKKGQHKRMRSREVSGDDPLQGLEKLEEIASPVQEESDAEAQQSPGGPGVLVAARQKEEESGGSTTTDTKDPTAKPDAEDVAGATDAKANISNATKMSEEQQPNLQLPPSSGFANASTASPFSSFKSPKSPSKETETISSPGNPTSNSAFASSGLSAFASSEKSPFGLVGSSAKPSGGFGGVGGQSGFGSSSTGLGGPSPFATKPVSGFGSAGGFGSVSGFGGAASGFGTPKPFSSGLSTFAGPAGAASSFGKPKPFGSSTQDDEDGSEDGGEDEEREKTEEDGQQDPRFKQQELETGEEGEETIFQCRAKLYHFDKEWKERGVGVLKVNIRYESKSIDGEAEAEAENDDSETGSNPKESEEEDVESGGQAAFSTVERRARLIMRTDGVHRVVLNTPVFKDMTVGTHDGQEPSGKTMHLTGLEEGKPTFFQIKVGKEDALKEIYYKIRELQEEL